MKEPQTRRQKFQESIERIQNLYDSDQANTLNGKMFETYSIPEQNRSRYLVVTGDVILGFNKTSDLPFLLQTEVGVTPEVAQKITAELIDAWGPVVEREAAEASSKKVGLGELADRIAAIRPSEVTPEDLNFLSEEIPQVEEPPADEHPIVKPIRTMEADAHRVHGYGALPQYQSDNDEFIIKSTPQDEIRPGV